MKQNAYIFKNIFLQYSPQKKNAFFFFFVTTIALERRTNYNPFKAERKQVVVQDHYKREEGEERKKWECSPNDSLISYKLNRVLCFWWKINY